MSEMHEKLPKYVQIKETLRKEIEEGVLFEGQQLGSETILIDRFGASKMTVIRALQELAQEGYLRRVQGKGTYITRPIKKAPLIGVLVPRTDQGIFTVVLHSIEQKAHELGYEILLCSTEEDADKVITFAERLIARSAAGVIAAPLERVNDPSVNVVWYERFLEEHIPIVLVDRGIEQIPYAPIIQTNNEEAMAQLAKEVIAMGHKRLLLVRLEEIQSTTTQARIAGFQKAAHEGNVELAEIIALSSKKSFTDIVAEFESILCELEPTVLMCLNDQIAIHVYSILKNLPSGIAENISITGFDDLAFSKAIGLTTVHQPLQEEGANAVEVLDRMIKHQPYTSVVIPSHVVMRSSLANLLAQASP